MEDLTLLLSPHQSGALRSQVEAEEVPDVSEMIDVAAVPYFTFHKVGRLLRIRIASKCLCGRSCYLYLYNEYKHDALSVGKLPEENGGLIKV